MILSEHLNNFEQGLINEKKTTDNFDKSNPVYKSLVEHTGKVNTKLCKTSLDKTALYEFALKEALHNEFPDKHWSEITGCDIRATLLESGNDIDKTARRIVESLKVKQEKETVKKETGALKENMRKKSLQEAKDREVDRRGFASLIKYGVRDPKGNYAILNDGNFVKAFWADDDEEAKETFSKWSSRKSEESLQERQFSKSWNPSKKRVRNKLSRTDADILATKSMLTDKKLGYDAPVSTYDRMSDKLSGEQSRGLEEATEWKYTLSCSDDLESAIDSGDLEEVVETLKGAYDELVDQELLDEGRRDKVVSALEQIDVYDDGAESKIEKKLDQFYNVCDKLGVKISFNESLKEDVRKEWKPNTNWSHLKDIMKKVADRGYKYVNNEREEIMSALDLADKKQKFKPEQRKELRDFHEKVWRKNKTSNESLEEDTVKQGSSWVNKGKEGTHGKFKTKKGADAQRKAMFANGYKEGLTEGRFDYRTYPLYEYEFTDGLFVIAPNEEEAVAKHDDILQNMHKGSPRSKEELDKIANDLYDNHDEHSFNYFSDEELAILWSMCMTTPDNHWGRAYDDEVYEAMSNRATKKDILELANKYLDNPKNEALTEAPIYDLTPQYDSRQSFYSKAKVDTGDKGDKNRLYSYNTLVAEIKDGKPVVYGTYSATTLRHIKDWLRQNGFKADSSKQIMADYGAKDEALTEKRGSKEVKDNPFDYERRLLGRLKSDCDYTLGACKDNGSSFDAVQKHLWAGNSGNQIAKMRELHQLSKDMDDIVTDSDIDTYEKRFRDWSKQEALTEASDGKSVENEFKNYRAFVANFNPITIKKNGKQYYVFKKGDEDGEHWIQYGNKDYIDGWLYGAVQAKMKIVESAKSKGGKKPLKERNLTKSERYNKMLHNTFANYRAMLERMKDYLRKNTEASEEEIEDAYQHTGMSSSDKDLWGLLKKYGVHDEFFAQDNKRNESLKEGKTLTEGASNFWSMDYFPLLVFGDYESAYEYADQQARDEIESDYDNMTDEEIEAYEDDAFNDPRYETLLDNAFDKYFDYCLLDEEEVDSLKDDIDSFNSSMKDKYYYGDEMSGVNSLDGEEWDGVYPSVEIKPGYYEAEQLYVNVEPKHDVIQNYKFFIQEQVDEVNKFLEEMKKKYRLTDLDVAWHASNGETGYSKK